MATTAKKKKLSVQDETNRILKENGLDYLIVKRKHNPKWADGKSIDSDFYEIVNKSSNMVLNMVKKSYTISQNYDIVEQVVKASRSFNNLEVVKAGDIHDGRKVYIQLAIEGDAFIGDDTVKRFVTIIDSKDGSTSLAVGIGDYTMSCENQFYQFYKKAQMKHRHSNSIIKRIEELQTNIEFSLSRSMRMTELYKEFQATKIDMDLTHALVEDLLGYSKETVDIDELKPRALNNMNTLYDNLHHQLSDKGLNLWGLHSGVTRWTTHDKQAPNRANGRLEGIISDSGTNYKANQKSFNFAMEHAGLVF